MLNTLGWQTFKKSIYTHHLISCVSYNSLSLFLSYKNSYYFANNIKRLVMVTEIRVYTIHNPCSNRLYTIAVPTRCTPVYSTDKMHTGVLKLVLLLKYMKLRVLWFSFHMCLDWFWNFNNLTLCNHPSYFTALKMASWLAETCRSSLSA